MANLSKKKQLGKYAKPKDLGKALKIPESALQKVCEDYLIIRRLAFIRIPDAVYREIFGRRSVSVRLRSLVSSYLKGLPDLTILFQSGHYLAIELKSRTGKMSQGQKNYKKLVGDNYYVIKSFDAFRKLIDEKIAEYNN